MTPCKGCKRRRVGCHAECEDYKAYRAALDEQNAKARAEKDAERLAYDIEIEAKRRMTRRFGKMKRKGWTK